MINYYDNYNNIINLVKKSFSLSEKDFKYFEERTKEGSALPREELHGMFSFLDNNHRFEIDLDEENRKYFDNSWFYFISVFNEYSIDNGISYSDFNRGINPKTRTKISKEILDYYSSGYTSLEKSHSKSEIRHRFDKVQQNRLPKKKLKLVITFNISDMFMCSTAHSWTSCLNLSSSYSGCYWHGLASLPFDKNRGMVSIVEKDSKVSQFDIHSEKIIARTFFLMDNENHLNTLKWYPNEMSNDKNLQFLNMTLQDNIFKNISKSITSNIFEPKYFINLPSIKGSKRYFYIYQDLTSLIKKNDVYKIIFSGGKVHQTFIDEESCEGPYVNIEEGLCYLLSSDTEFSNFLESKRIGCCHNCDCSIHRNDDHFFSNGGHLYCESCYHEMYAFCNNCGSEIHSEDYNYDEDCCVTCANEEVEVV